MKTALFAVCAMAMAGLGIALNAQVGLPTEVPALPLPEVHRAVVPGGLLKIEDADPAAQAAVSLDALDIHAVLNGLLAETRITLTFRNSLNRPLEGELEFPLPGAAVVGYGLDVPAGSGVLVEGVCVEKQKARQVFESEVRRGIDPGLVEQTRGNSYRTRVHPIPPNGTRTVQITYVSDLVDVWLLGGDQPDNRPSTRIYSLPLNFAGNLKSARIHIEAGGVADPALLEVQGLANLAFEKRGDLIVAEKTFANIALSGSLTIRQPPTKEAITARVETRVVAQNVDNFLSPPDSRRVETYFMVSTIAPPVPLMKDLPAAPKIVGIVWDTSLSRANADRTLEYDTLKEVAKSLPGTTTLEVLDTAGQPLKTFSASEADALVSYLKGLPCDGALSIDGLRQKLRTELFRSTSVPVPGMYLFFSDGLVSLGERRLGPSDAPIFTLCSDPKADHFLLKNLAEQAGGLYVNLQRTSPADAAKAVLAPAIVMSLSGPIDGGKMVLQEVYPSGSVRVTPGQRVTFTGRLHANQTTAILTSGLRAGEMKTQEIILSNGNATSTGLVPRYWAQQKSAALSVDPDKNAAALLSLGKEFNLVTSETSLMVLETVDQYLRHRIVPPKSRVDVYQDFVKRIEVEGVNQKKAEAEKIDHVLALWNERVKWWETKFDPPTREAILLAKEKNARNTGAPSAAGDTTALGGAVVPAAIPAAPAEGETRAVRELRGGYLMRREARERSDQSSEKPSDSSTAAVIKIQPWSPAADYLRAMAGQPDERTYAIYLDQRKTHFDMPSFYLDCGNFLIEHGQRELGIRVLTNIAQLRLENAALLRVAAYRLMQVGELDVAIDLFETARRLRPDEPQSARDLALAYQQQGLSEYMRIPDRDLNISGRLRALEKLRHALELYNTVIMNKWERFDEIEIIALMEANALWAQIQTLSGFELVEKQHPFANPVDPRLIKNLDCDARIVMTWDADDTDMDLHVIEPTTEEASYANNRTLAGGLVSRDFTQGYGPEEYAIHKAVPGTYKIVANYFGSQQQTIQGPVTVHATVITNFGRPNEKRESMTLRLTDQKENVPIGEITIGALR